MVLGLWICVVGSLRFPPLPAHFVNRLFGVARQSNVGFGSGAPVISTGARDRCLEGELGEISLEALALWRPPNSVLNFSPSGLAEP